MSSALDLITSALRMLKVVSSDETPSAEDAATGLRALNQMIESWNTERLSIYTISAQIFDLVAGQQSYTIGPGGNFNTARPIAIQNANIILAQNNPQVRLSIALINDDEWAYISARAIPSTIPRKLYNDGAFPLSTLSFWGVPGSGLQVELFTWQALPTFPSLKAALTFPPGYERALRFNLAVELTGDFPETQPFAPVALAAQSKAAIQGLNTPNLLMEADPAVMSTNVMSTTRRLWNYFTGE